MTSGRGFGTSAVSAWVFRVLSTQNHQMFINTSGGSVDGIGVLITPHPLEEARKRNHLVRKLIFPTPPNIYASIWWKASCAEACIKTPMLAPAKVSPD